MILPTTRRRQKLREKKCQYPGCNKVFFGIHVSKYCHQHRDDRFRIRRRAIPEDVNIKNQTFPHDFEKVTDIQKQCALEGCHTVFLIKIHPRQYVYPKYCPEHRNEYKRIRHLQRIGRSDLIQITIQEFQTITPDISMMDVVDPIIPKKFNKHTSGNLPTSKIETITPQNPPA